MSNSCPKLEQIAFSHNSIMRMPNNIDLLNSLAELDLSNNQITQIGKLPPNLKLVNLSFNRIRNIPAQIFTLESIDTVELNDNLIADWTEGEMNGLVDVTEFHKGSVKTLNVANYSKLGQPPAPLLKYSNISKLLLTGCNVQKKDMLMGMEKNGVFEYQERHKKKLNQAVDNRLDVDYKIFGLE